MLFFIKQCLAAGLGDGFTKAENIGKGAGLTNKSFVDVIESLLKNLMIIIPITAVAVIIIGGVYYIISAGDEKKAATAKNAIMYALIGLIVVGLAALLVQVVLTAVKGA